MNYSRQRGGEGIFDNNKKSKEGKEGKEGKDNKNGNDDKMIITTTMNTIMAREEYCIGQPLVGEEAKHGRFWPGERR